MEDQEFWIDHGKLAPPPVIDPARPGRDRELLGREGRVRVTVGRTGTTVTWVAFSANWASLYFTKEWIGTFPGPYTLKYFVAGWFTETLEDPAQARDRLDCIMANGDIRLSASVYIKDMAPKQGRTPTLLLEALEQRNIDEAHSVDCLLDPRTEQFRVARVGDQSQIARYYGTISPVSYPCHTGHTYDRIVSAAYREVWRSRKPNYSHVYAAMVRPDSEVVWIPYHRVILPGNEAGKSPRVTIISQIAPVDITVV
jgi:hypothetical protein